MALLEAENLTKVFRRADRRPGLPAAVKHLVQRRFTYHTAVDHINLSIEAGEAVAYVGPNGAGKSTTVKLLSGILEPTEGSVRINGRVPQRSRRAVAQEIGVLFGQRTQLWWDLPVSDSLSLLRDIYRVDQHTYQARLRNLDDVLGIGEFMGTVARKLSLGQRMRADLAAALIHGPRIIYLDEPTIGLDLTVKDRVREFLRSLRDDGVMVMLTSHDLADIEGFCRRLVIIDDGRIIFDGALDAVKDEFARERVLHIRTASPADLGPLRAALPKADVSVGDTATTVSVRFDRFVLTAGEVVEATGAIANVVDFKLDEPTIEDVIRRVYSGELVLRTGTPATAESRPA
ncbi:ATP-binding cassette domain-containing protein [Actinoplanes sp. KI2]|uniref:ABC transporter ATP-binding protein n=1 Tax=Actinoplanes sp. KI2 TaxID=2983315 RepID=UPI0021D5FBE0|nr:ATP-binding cassette domain-containing protein [Actinoplanes sp. KI2]MCU7725965.1 ATP-binding cassette domain-containing protein [Actinoplanes sp. KI2]